MESPTISPTIVDADDEEPFNGLPGDEVPFNHILTPDIAWTSTAGWIYGLMRVTDPENGMDLSAIYAHQGLPPGVLEPDSRKQEVVNYQIVKMLALPTITSVTVPTAYCGTAITILPVFDLPLPEPPEEPNFAMTYAWDFRDPVLGSGFTPALSTDARPSVGVTGAAGNYLGTLTITFPEVGKSQVFPFPYTIPSGPNPTCVLPAGTTPFATPPGPVLDTGACRYDIATFVSPGGIEIVTVAYFQDVAGGQAWPTVVQFNGATGAILTGPLTLAILDGGTTRCLMVDSEIEILPDNASDGSTWLVAVADSTDGNAVGPGGAGIWGLTGMGGLITANPIAYSLVDDGVWTINAPYGEVELLQQQDDTFVLIAGTQAGGCVDIPGCQTGLTAITAKVSGLPSAVTEWFPPVLLDNYSSKAYSVSADMDPFDPTRIIVSAAVTEVGSPGEPDENNILIYDNLDLTQADLTSDASFANYNHDHTLTTPVPGGATTRFSGGEAYVVYATPLTECPNGSPNSGLVKVAHSPTPESPETWQSYTLFSAPTVTCGTCGWIELNGRVSFEVLGGRPAVGVILYKTGCGFPNQDAQVWRACSATPTAACDWSFNPIAADMNLPGFPVSAEVGLGFGPATGVVGAFSAAATVGAPAGVTVVQALPPGW